MRVLAAPLSRCVAILRKLLFISTLLSVVGVSPVSAGLLDFYNGVTIGKQLPEHDFQFVSALPATDGQLLLIDFWATWCAPCLESIPRLNAWQNEFAKDGLVIIGVSQESKGVVMPFLAKFPMQYSPAVEGVNSLHKALGIKGLPYAIFVDHLGKIVWRGQPTEISSELIVSLLHTKVD